MRNKYQQVMDKVQVTDDMRQRVLQNVVDSVGEQPKPKVTKVNRAIPLAIAACLVVALVVVSVPRLTSPDHQLDDGDDTPKTDVAVGDQSGAPTFDSTECATLDELAEKCGFEPKQLGYVPFDVVSTTYELYAEADAKTTYTSSDGQTVTLTQFLQSENTGEIDGLDMQGNDKGYDFAVWLDGDYGFSLTLSDTVSEAEMKKMIASLQ